MCGRVGTDLGGVVVLALRAVLALPRPHVEPAVWGAGPLRITKIGFMIQDLGLKLPCEDNSP